MTISTYDLCWQGFSDCFTSAFKNLAEDDIFSDITLICEQNMKLKVHKVIISACSSFFRRILLDLPSSHLFLYVDGVTFEDLKGVINFIYSGRAVVEKENLDKFMNVCEKLEIVGLPEKAKDINDTIEAENEKIDEADTTSDLASVDKSETTDEVSSLSEANEGILEFKYTTEMFKGERTFICEFCYKIFHSKSHLKGHFENKHLNIRYPCSKCDYTTGDKSNLTKHEKSKHDKLKRHQCNFCNYKCFARGDLRSHVKKKHSERASIKRENQ